MYVMSKYTAPVVVLEQAVTQAFNGCFVSGRSADLTLNANSAR